jgi:hypothetical protein
MGETMLLLGGIGLLRLAGARVFARPALPRPVGWHGWRPVGWHGWQAWHDWWLPMRAQIRAARRARALLRDLLTEREYRTLTRHGYLEVASPSNAQRVYRIPGGGGLVRVYDGGTAVMDLCLQPAEPLPEGDVVLLHKLMIEGNEQEYLARANHFAPGIFLMRRPY